MQRGVFVRNGSSKVLYDAGCDADGKRLLNFEFTSGWSAFDVGTAPEQPIPGKDEAICACALKSFEIAQAVGVATHFVQRLNATTIQVRQVDVIADRALTFADTDCVVPAEWIDRPRLAGSLRRAFLDGKKLPTAYGFVSDEVPPEGTVLPYPIGHFTTKFEKTDRDLTRAAAREMCGMSEDDETQFWAMIHTLNGAMAIVWQRAGFARLDGKKECLLVGPKRTKMIGDVFGTPDEDRPVLLSSLKAGHVEHYGKEFLREYLIKIGFYQQVLDARAAQQPDPPYPIIPASVMAEVSRRYRMFADSYCGAAI
ncbi:MAG: phosphoribosylaminoimidazolesuccinocarboxamide synthase [Patescibacteria group bacterium]|nr:phosphoribosylaminoimidazolesuccinocarboxamide synthase [Patescibacteria group bacterium]